MGKKFEELDVIDDYLMTAISADKELGEEVNRLLVSTLLQRKLGKIHVTAQKVLQGVLPGYRGIRMDVEIEEPLEDEDEKKNDNPKFNVYDVEPHLENDINFPRHNRFRQARIDSQYMNSGDGNFNHFPNLYMIMILNFDLFERDYMMYTFRNTCEEEPDIPYEDGLKFIYFYTGGTKGGNEQIRNLLRYLADSNEENVVDDTTKQIHQLVKKAKQKPEMREAYMTWDMYIDKMKEKEREAGEIITKISIIRKRIVKGKDIEEIAEGMDMEISELQPLYDLVANNPEKTEQELVEEYLKSKQLQTV